MAYDYLSIKKSNHLATLCLRREAARNALNYEFLLEIEHAVHSFREDPETRVVIFAAAGPHFCAGADLNAFRDNTEETKLVKRRRLRMGERVMQAVLSMDQISICAWNGGAIGGGGCLATATDFRIGAEDCFLQYPEIDLGLNLMWQSLPRTVRLVGESRAMRLAVGGERVHAKILLDWGLLEEVVPVENLQASTEAFAETYLKKPPVAAQMIKRSLSAVSRHLDQAFMHMDADQHMLASSSDDHRSAVEAYIEKREGKFVGD